MPEALREDLGGLNGALDGAGAGAGFCVLCSYYYLQPLSDALALKVGLEFTPAITASNVMLIAIANPLYAALVKALPVMSVLPIVYGVLASLLVVFGILFSLLPDSSVLSFCFAVFTGTFSLFLTTTFWARMASLHTKSEAKRVFGVIASGAQVGQLCASISAAWVYSVLQQRIVFWSALLVSAFHPHIQTAPGPRIAVSIQDAHCLLWLPRADVRLRLPREPSWGDASASRVAS